MAIWDELSPRETDRNLRSCSHCQTEFIPGRRTQLYCSPECRVAYWKFHRQQIEIELSNTNTVISATLNHVSISPKSITIKHQEKILPRRKLAICSFCNRKYNQVRAHQKFCSSQCRYKNWISTNL